jgi:hypothetical protein
MSSKDVDLVPDAAKFPPETKVTPSQIAASEAKIKNARESGDPNLERLEAERAQLLHQQLEELQRISLRKMTPSARKV